MTVAYDSAPHVTGDQWLCLHRNENLFLESKWRDELAAVASSAHVSSYPDPKCVALRAAIAEMCGVDSANVYVGNGSDEVLSSLLGWLRLDYATMRANPVGYRMYPVLAARHGFMLEATPLSEDGGLPGDAAREAVVVVDSPNAITGARFEPSLLDRLTTRNSDFLIWDNCYGEFAGDPMPACIGNRAVVRTFSKYYGLAGLRVGYCIVDAHVVERLHERKDIFNVNGVAQAAAIHALRHRDVFARARVDMIRARDTLISILGESGFVVTPSSGNFVFASHRELPAATILAELAARQIAVRRFTGIGRDNFLRITVPPSSDAERVRCALDEIAAQAAV